ncbi:MAG: polysaccharide biosynthesis/export family protein [Pyrinomonadaceae bacterium]
MKSLVFAALVLSASLAMTASGQVKSVAAANNQPSSKPAKDPTPPNSARVRVLGQDPKVVPPGKSADPVTLQSQARPDFNNHADATRFRRTSASAALVATDSANKTSAEASAEGPRPDSSSAGHSSLKPAGSTATRVGPPVNIAALASAPIAATSTQVYRVGAGDVLDIQLADNPGRNSTLFTVLDDGVLEYPLAGDPFVVGGLTTAEIAALLRQRIKILDNPKVKVDVRDYASHVVSISGFVAAPGTKILRREAMPLYALLAESLVLPEAARATITREGQAPLVVDLNSANLSATLVVPGDAIKVTGMPPLPAEFFFVGGEISSPGQKPFHVGLTLTQAILASGGTKNSAGSKVRVSRQSADGRLTSEEFNLRKIQSGKTPDPVLQKGDRIEVTTR